VGGSFVDGLDRRDRGAFAMGVGGGEGPLQTLRAKDDYEAMALAGFNDHLGVADLFYAFREQIAQFLTGRGFDAAGAAVCDNAFGVEGTEVRACRGIAGLQFDTESARFEDAAANMQCDR